MLNFHVGRSSQKVICFGTFRTKKSTKSYYLANQLAWTKRRGEEMRTSLRKRQVTDGYNTVQAPVYPELILPATRALLVRCFLKCLRALQHSRLQSNNNGGSRSDEYGRTGGAPAARVEYFSRKAAGSLLCPSKSTRHSLGYDAVMVPARDLANLTTRPCPLSLCLVLSFPLHVQDFSSDLGVIGGLFGALG